MSESILLIKVPIKFSCCWLLRVFPPMLFFDIIILSFPIQSDAIIPRSAYAQSPSTVSHHSSCLVNLLPPLSSSPRVLYYYMCAAAAAAAVARMNVNDVTAVYYFVVRIYAEWSEK